MRAAPPSLSLQPLTLTAAADAGGPAFAVVAAADADDPADAGGPAIGVVAAADANVAENALASCCLLF